MNTIKELYAYREMIFSLVRRDLKGRYKGSALGFMWTFLNPLLQLGIYTMVFSVIMRSGIEDFYLFLFVALVPWIFFSASITGGASSITSQSEMVKKIYFPREVLPIAFVTGQFINMLLSFIVIFVVLIISGKGINLISIPFLIPVMLLEYILALGIALITSSVTVYLRDVEHILGIITMGWQFMTPVIYSIDMVPERLRYIFNLNPMTPIVNAYRDILYYKRIPDMHTLLHGAVLGVMLLIIGMLVFSKLKHHFAEEL